MTLVGADTILAQEEALAKAPGPGPKPDGPLLAVVDGRQRVSAWDALRDAGHWRDVVALRARDGEEHVDLAEALRDLDARVVRVDSGGTLIGVLLQAGLLDELSLLVHPCLAEPGGPRWHGDGVGPVDLELIAAEPLEGGLVWMRYRLG